MICIYLKFYVIFKIISTSVLCANNFLFPFFSSFALEVCLFLLVFSKNYLFINFAFGRTGSSLIATQGLSLVVMGRGYSSLWCKGLIAAASLVAGHGLQHTGLVAPRHVEFSWIRDRSCVPVLAGGLSTLAHQGSPRTTFLIWLILYVLSLFSLSLL